MRDSKSKTSVLSTMLELHSDITSKALFVFDFGLLLVSDSAAEEWGVGFSGVALYLIPT